jgi:enoyl-CoA hydratase/carnithine racemase
VSTRSDLPNYRTLLMTVDRGVATITLNRAVQLGLGSRVLDADDVLPAALELAHDIAANTAPMSVAASKRLLWDSFELDRAAVGARETDIHLQVMRHDDAREGVRAYLERRPPVWTGTPADPTAD